MEKFNVSKTMPRREMIRLSCAAAATTVMMSPSSIKAKKEIPHKSVVIDHDRLSYRAYRTTTFEGELTNMTVEGEIPRSLAGRLIKVGPGQKENNGTRLKHFFDGDAYVYDISFDQGQVNGRAKFINTPERQKELESRRMIFNEFGTQAPRRTRKLKKQANVNIISWGDDLLALNEGSAPCRIKKDTLEFLRFEDFNGVLPGNVSFAGHPKFDPKTGKGYSFGIEQGLRKSFYIFEFDSKNETLKVLYRLPQRKLFMVHDMLMSENLLAFYLPPVYFNITDIALNRGAIGDSLKYDDRYGGELLIISKDGTMKPTYIPMPKKIVFHHGNAFEKDDQLHFVSFAANGMGLIDYIAKWNEKSEKPFSMPQMTKYTVDLREKKLIHEKALLQNHDFPHFDQQKAGQEFETLYALHGGDDRDPISFPALSKVNINTGESLKLSAGAHTTYGEGILAGSGDERYLLTPGYSGERDESFVDIIEPENLKRVGRVWLGRHVPVGFHGFFLKD